MTTIYKVVNVKKRHFNTDTVPDLSFEKELIRSSASMSNNNIITVFFFFFWDLKIILKPYCIGQWYSKDSVSLKK